MRRALTFGSGAIFVHGTALCVHLAIGTPRLILSMAPGLVIGTTFIGLYVNAMARAAPSEIGSS